MYIINWFVFRFLLTNLLQYSHPRKFIGTPWDFFMKETSRRRITVYVVYKSLINWEMGGGGWGRISPSAPVPFGHKFKDDVKVFPPPRMSASWHFSFSLTIPSINTPHTCLRRMNLHSREGFSPGIIPLKSHPYLELEFMSYICWEQILIRNRCAQSNALN
jgi:hypothetical protein